MNLAFRAMGPFGSINENTTKKVRRNDERDTKI